MSGRIEKYLLYVWSENLTGRNDLGDIGVDEEDNIKMDLWGGGG
jgi:hypothetical protein